MSLLDPAPIPVLSDEEAQYRAATRPTGFGEYLGAKLAQGFDSSLAGRAYEAITQPQPTSASSYGKGSFIPAKPGPPETTLSEPEFKASTYWRDGIDYTPGLTPDLAKAKADAFDERRYRESLISRYSGSTASYVAGFGAAVLGGAFSPENFIPFVGPEMRAAMVARMGIIGGHVAAGVADAAIGTALVDPIVFADLNRRGENLGVQDFALDMTLGAVAGGLFGLGGGLLHRPEVIRDTARAVRIDGLQRQADALDVAHAALVRDEPVDVGAIVGGDARLNARADADLQRRLLGSSAIPEPYRPTERAPIDEALGGSEPTLKPDQPQSFLGFLRASGGIKPSSELDFNFGELQKAVVGVVRKNGLKIDEMVGRAVEAGYLPVKEGINDASRADELYALIDGELSGSRAVPETTDAKALRLQQDRHQIDKNLISAAKEHGGISGNELAIARDLVEQHHMSDEDAIVQAMTFAALRNEEGGFDGGVHADAFDIPFDHVPDGAAVSNRGGPVPGAGERGAAGLGGGAEVGGKAAIARHVADFVTTERAIPPHPSVIEAERSVKRAPPANGLEEAKRLAEDLGVKVGVTSAKPEPTKPGAEPPTPEKIAAEKMAEAKALAADTPEMQDIAVMRRDGLLTPDDERSLAEADDLVKAADGWADAYNVLSSCVLRHG